MQPYLWSFFQQNTLQISKVGCVFLMVVVSLLPNAEFGRNDHREDAPHFINFERRYRYFSKNKVSHWNRLVWRTQKAPSGLVKALYQFGNQSTNHDRASLSSRVPRTETGWSQTERMGPGPRNRTDTNQQNSEISDQTIINLKLRTGPGPRKISKSRTGPTIFWKSRRSVDSYNWEYFSRWPRLLGTVQ